MPPRAQISGTISQAVRRHVLDQSDHAPQDQQQRPPVSEPVPDGKAEAEIPQQEISANDDQDERPGDRAPITIQRREAVAAAEAEDIDSR